MTQRETKPARQEDAQRVATLRIAEGVATGAYWIRADGFCYACGKADVWQETFDSEDYYPRV